MAKITVNIEIHGTLDADVIADEVNYHLRKQLKSIKPEPLKVGDYVRIVSSKYGHYFSVGEVVKITESRSSIGDYLATDLGDVRNYYVREEEFVRANNEEINAEKWAKIERNPNEFKVGDIVRYKEDGEICEVVGIDEDGLPEVQTNHQGLCTETPKYVELVTPVEARFDR